MEHRRTRKWFMVDEGKWLMKHDILTTRSSISPYVRHNNGIFMIACGKTKELLI